MVTAHLLNDPESLIGTFFHLNDYPNAAQALATLKRVASLVKPIMRKHGWRISKLAEFYPEMEPNLLGLNTSFPGTSRLPIIQVRLRQPYDNRMFLDYEAIVQTMLHELTHCKFGPHDDKFWNQFRLLQGELDTLRYSGYTGEGFMGKGQALGDVPRGLSQLEAKRKAREAAERRRKADQSRGRILGSFSLGPFKWTIEESSGDYSTLRPRGDNRGRPSGSGRLPSAPPVPYANPQKVAADAALKRQRDSSRTNRNLVSIPIHEPTPRSGGVCSGVRHSTTEQMDNEIAQMHGFESIADMESANEQAIMIAAMELLEEADREEAKLKAQEGEMDWQPTASSSSRPIDLTRPDPISRTQSAPVRRHPTDAPILSPGWSCPVCTYNNEESHLQCSLCRVERNTGHFDDSETKAQIVALKNFEEKQKRHGHGHGNGSSSSSSSSTGRKGKEVARPKESKLHPDTWTCHRCKWLTGQEWWSCGNCGTVKLQS